MADGAVGAAASEARAASAGNRRWPPPRAAVMSGGARRPGTSGAKLLSPPPTEGEDPLSTPKGSPLSLASRSSSPGCKEEERVAASRSPPGDRKAEHPEIAGARKILSLKGNLSPWEEWFIGKEKELRARLQARVAEEMNKQLEKMKQNQESERRKRIAEEKHKEWVEKKREEERRERKRKMSKEMAEKATRELEKMQLQEKAEIKYKEWLKKKRAEEAEKKKKEKEKEKEREAELQEKRTRSEKIFKEWLQNSRNKPQPALNGYGFPHGTSTGRAGRNLYPAPAYCNPIPWKPVHVPPSKEDSVLTMKKRPVSCQLHASLPVVISKPKSNLGLDPSAQRSYSPEKNALTILSKLGHK